ncbi:phosphoribosylaminoimidazolesuccinocarboxamide synthase [Lacticaseibacillus saniviri]
MTIQKLDLLYQGKAKAVYATTDPEQLWISYKDQATALNGKRKETIDGKGALNLHISQRLFQVLAEAAIPTHYVRTLDATSMLCQRAAMLPLEVVVRNFASGHFVSKFHVAPMQALEPAIHELYYKDDALDDPFINDDQVLTLQITDARTLTHMRQLSDRVNAVLRAYFENIAITLVDFKLEFGYLSDGTLVVADELSPDNMRLVDAATGDSLDKDVFRQETGDLVAIYREVAKRLDQIV